MTCGLAYTWLDVSHCEKKIKPALSSKFQASHVYRVGLCQKKNLKKRDKEKPAKISILFTLISEGPSAVISGDKQIIQVIFLVSYVKLEMRQGHLWVF